MTGLFTIRSRLIALHENWPTSYGRSVRCFSSVDLAQLGLGNFESRCSDFPTSTHTTTYCVVIAFCLVGDDAGLSVDEQHGQRSGTEPPL